MLLNLHRDKGDYVRAVAKTKLNVARPTAFWEVQRLIGKTFDRGGKSGVDGWGGPQGQTGPYGLDGAHGVGYGAHGHDGRPGEKGEKGLPGNVGQNGQNGSRLNVSIAGVSMDPDNLSVEVTDRGKSKSVVTFNTPNQYIMLRTAGGDAGPGGRGGKGGTGGGDGAAGYPGGNSAATCNGGPGGDGGDGGNGGPGGPGGVGGAGGNGGHASSITVSVVDPAVLMALRVDISGGVRGAGGGAGPGGDGGRPGEGGYGGPGGPAGSYTTTEYYTYTDSQGYTQTGTNTVTHYGSPGRSGSNGRRGSWGSDGDDGIEGPDGIDGQPGSVEYFLKNAVGKVIEKGVVGYNLRLVGLDIVDGMSDGIFEPLEEIFISNVTLLNDGDMSVPIGVVFAVLGTLSITSDMQNATDVPPIGPKLTVVLPPTFRMRLADVPLPTTPGPLAVQFNFNTDCTLLKRQFLKSAVVFTLDVAWPICITSISSPTQMGRNETRPFMIVVTNKSLIPYCVGPDTEGKLVIAFEAGLIPRDPRSQGAVGKPWTVEIPLTAIAPGASVTVSMDVTCWEGSEFFDRTPWRANLFLRNRLIEYSEQKVRTAPDWHNDFADVPQDAILFTGEHISLPDYIAWRSIFRTLTLGFWMWDSERYRGISVDSATKQLHGNDTWRGARPGPIFIFPSNPQQQQGLICDDIIAHFMKFPMSSGTLVPGKYIDDSGFVFFGSSPGTLDMGIASVGEPVDIADWNLKFEGTHLSSSIGDKAIMEKALSLTKKIGEKDPGYPYRLLTIEKDVNKEGFLKYSYGNVIIRRVPFKKYAKMIFAPVNISSAIGLTNLETTSLALGSPYGQCMVLVISALPIHTKLRILKITNSPINFTAVEGKTTLTFWPADLLKIMLYRDLRTDVEHGETKEYPHALALQQAVQTDPALMLDLNTRLASFYALERLLEKKSIFSSNKPINSIKDALKEVLFKNFKKDEYDAIKKNNEAVIKEHKKLKMAQYFGEGVVFFFSAKQGKK